MKIYFSGARIGEKRLLSRVLDYAVENLRQPERLSLSLSFLDEEKMRALNKETRGADKPTDVLSFQYLDYIKAGEKVDLDAKILPIFLDFSRFLLRIDCILGINIERKNEKSWCYRFGPRRLHRCLYPCDKRNR